MTHFDITLEIFNQNCSFKMWSMQNFLTHILQVVIQMSILTNFLLWNHTVYEITKVQEYWSCTFCQIGLIAPCNVWHWNISTICNNKTAYTQWSTLSPHWRKLSVFTQNTLFNKTGVLHYENNSKEWPLKL